MLNNIFLPVLDYSILDNTFLQTYSNVPGSIFILKERKKRGRLLWKRAEDLLYRCDWNLLVMSPGSSFLNGAGLTLHASYVNGNNVYANSSDA